MSIREKMTICNQWTPKLKELGYSKPSILSDIHLPQAQRVNLTRDCLDITTPIIDVSKKKKVLGNLPKIFWVLNESCNYP